MKTIAIVGGGMTGLSAALALADADQPVRIVLLEASDSFGGVCRSQRWGDVLCEEGPDSLVITKPASIELCERLGVELVPTLPSTGGALIAKGNRLLPLPEGFQLMAPSRFLPFVRTDHVSWPGKLRMGLDLLLPRGRYADDEDVSLAEFVRRRLGQEALDRLAQPLIAGIYSGDPERLSLRSTMPDLLGIEDTYRSLTLGMRARAKARPDAKASGARYGLFRTPLRGMAAIPAAVVAALDGKAELRTGAKVLGIDRREGGWTVRLAGESLDVQGVILATPHTVAASLLAPHAPSVATALRGIRTSSTATLNMLFRRSAFRRAGLPRGNGFVVPAVEQGRTLMACTFATNKYPGRGDDEHFLLRGFIGGELGRAQFGKGDEELRIGTMADLRALLGVSEDPVRSHLRRWTNAQPQYELGHIGRVRRIEQGVAAIPGLELAGNAFAGVGLGNVVVEGRQAAERLLAAAGSASEGRT